MFEKGGYIVYGTTGVCQIEDITGMKSKGASGEKLYYVLRPCFQKGNTIFTPVDNGKIAMRAAMTREDKADSADRGAGGSRRQGAGAPLQRSYQKR